MPLGKSDSEKASDAPKEPAANAKERERDREGEKFTASAGTTTPSGGENSVYRVGFDGSARELFREKGLIRSEGKEYVVKDGDVCFFKFSS